MMGYGTRNRVKTWRGTVQHRDGGPRIDRKCSRKPRIETHLLVEDGLGLATVAGLLTVVAALALRGERVLALLVLRDLVRSGATSSAPASRKQNIHVRVLAALLASAVCPIASAPLSVSTHALQRSFARAPDSHVRRVLQNTVRTSPYHARVLKRTSGC
jgi:hypothetical protein